MPAAGVFDQDAFDLETAWASTHQPAWLGDADSLAPSPHPAAFTPNSARFAAVLRAAEDFLGGGACRTQVLLTTLQDACWHEVPGAFAVAIFRACAVSAPRASLAAEFSKIVDLVVLSACGSLRHDAIHSWVLSNWNVFARGLIEVLLELLESDELTLQPARSERARRAFRVAIDLAGAVRKYMALDALKSTNGVHALLAVCDNDTGSGSVLHNGYHWEHENAFYLMTDKQRLKLKASMHAPISYAHAIFMEEIAAAIEQAEPGVNDIDTWKTAFGFFASSTLWRQFAHRCKMYVRSKNRQLRREGIRLQIAPLEATSALLKRIEGACAVVRASARFKARQEIKRKLEEVEPVEPVGSAAETPSDGRSRGDDTPPRPTRLARLARPYETRPSRESSDASADSNAVAEDKTWLDELFDEAFPQSGVVPSSTLRGNGTCSPVPVPLPGDEVTFIDDRCGGGVPADDAPSLPAAFILPSHYDADARASEPPSGAAGAAGAADRHEEELNRQIERTIERATGAFEGLRGLAAKGVEAAQQLDEAGFPDDEWSEIVKEFQRNNEDNWKEGYRQHVRLLTPCLFAV